MTSGALAVFCGLASGVRRGAAGRRSCCARGGRRRCRHRLFPVRATPMLDGCAHEQREHEAQDQRLLLPRECDHAREVADGGAHTAAARFVVGLGLLFRHVGKE